MTELKVALDVLEKTIQETEERLKKLREVEESLRKEQRVFLDQNEEAKKAARSIRSLLGLEQGGPIPW